MLSELRVSGLGVIEDLSLVFGSGMTALTGETGAGKTLLVEAVQLLLGARAGPLLVRPGSPEALVEGRFLLEGGEEVVVSRTVPKEGRSRAYLNGRMATVGALEALGRRLADLHGQHSHQSLFSPAAQRDALDAWAGLSGDRARREAARSRLRRAERQLAALGAGGKAGAKAGAVARGYAGTQAGRQASSKEAWEREAELLSFQLAELEGAALRDPNEADALRAEEEKLARAASHRSAAAAAYDGLSGDDQALDKLGQVVRLVAGHGPLSAVHERLQGLQAELADAAGELRSLAEALEEGPARLEEVAARRALLAELCRKYAGPGEGLAGVLGFAAEARRRLAELEARGALVAELESERAKAAALLSEATVLLGRARREAAAGFARAVEARLKELAMPQAEFSVAIGGLLPTGGAVAGRPSAAGSALGDDGAQGDRGALADGDPEEVAFLLAADRGEPLLPLSKVASGGELSRAMLALRLALLQKGAGAAGPETLIFDEVDTGIGGEAALAVGRALAKLGERYQVLVVTHLPQVAAFAGSQVAVAKLERGGRAIATARYVTGEERVIELSRMLSGQPESRTAHRHAEELLRRVAGR